MTSLVDGGPRLADGLQVRLRDDLRHRNGGRLLVGGSPVRALRLSDRALAMTRGGVVVVRDAASEALAARLIDGNLAWPVLDDVGADPDHLTVVVPVRDRAAQLDQCLRALTALRVVVVDDASDDPAAVAAVAAQHGAHLLPLASNVGPAGARNAGLREVTTPLVAFVDSDVVVSPAALLRLARHLEVDGKVALAGPLVRGRAGSARPRWFERYDVAASSLDLGARPCSVRPGAAVAWLPSACLVGRVEALGEGFDASLRVGEDVDLVWRLVAAGAAVRYDPAAVALHDVRTSVRGWLGRKVLYGTGGAELARRHADNGAPAVLAPTTAVAAATLLARRWWALPVTGATIAHRARAVQRALPEVPGRTWTALSLATEGTAWAVRQESALLLRHWWPLGLVGGLLSRHVRRALVTALVIDVSFFLRERPGTGLATALAGRRLDDLAYGTGLWIGAARARSSRCLRVRWLRR